MDEGPHGSVLDGRKRYGGSDGRALSGAVQDVGGKAMSDKCIPTSDGVGMTMPGPTPVVQSFASTDSFSINKGDKLVSVKAAGMLSVTNPATGATISIPIYNWVVETWTVQDLN